MSEQENGAQGAPVPALTGARAFGVLWFGQMVSMIGSGLTRFALGVWVLETTGSPTRFTLTIFFATLPAVLVSPLAGVVIDRVDRRRLMMFNNVAAALGTLVVVLILTTGSLAVWHVYLVVAWGSLISAFELPALIAVTTLLVPKQHLGRASGMLQFGQAVSGVVAPVVAGLLYAWQGLTAVILVDGATFLFAFVALLVIRVPTPPPSAATAASRGSLWRQAIFGWAFIRARPGLLGLLIYFAMVNLVLSMVLVLVYPLVQSFTPDPAVYPKVIGTVLAVASAGLLAGSVLMTVFGGPRRRIHGVLAGGLAASVAVAIAGLWPWAVSIAGGLFLLMLSVPLVNGCSQAIWQLKVPPDIQGRVFATRRMIAQFTSPLGYLVAGPLADFIEPLMRAGGALAGGPLGSWIGTGPGRGIALIFLCLAGLPALFSLWGYSQPRIRDIEDQLPDAVSS